jgi:Ca2+-binding RTX toxin-like protein
MLGFALLGLLGLGLIVGLNGDDDDNSFGSDEGTQEQGTNGDDLIDAADGNDTVFASDGDDVVLAGDGNDRVFGGDGDDLIVGEDGDDFLRGGSGDDLIFGSAGEDTINGDVGDDQIIGADIIDARGLFDATENAIIAGIPLTDADIASFVDLDADTDEADVLNGGVGNDIIVAGSNDIVNTGTGSDIVNVGQWVNPDEPVQITDFNPFQDDIVYSYEGRTEPDVAFGEAEDGTATLVVDGRVVAFFENADLFDLRNGTSIILERLT